MMRTIEEVKGRFEIAQAELDRLNILIEEKPKIKETWRYQMIAFAVELLGWLLNE